MANALVGKKISSITFIAPDEYAAEAMRDFLDGVETKWGSAMEYLEKIGITENQMEKIRHNFLE